MQLHKGTIFALAVYPSSVLAEVVTTGTVQVSSSCTAGALDWLQGFPDPLGDFRTAISTASLRSDFTVGIPADECGLLAQIPPNAYPDYLTYVSKVHTWWDGQKSAFSKWSSTCTGTLGNGQEVYAYNNFREGVTPFLEPTAQARLNNYSPTAITCPTTTIAPATTRAKAAAPRKTPVVGAALAVAAVACAAVGV